MKTIYIPAERAEALSLRTRSFIGKLPILAVAAAVVYAFVRSPLWPYHLVTHPWVYAFVRLLSNSNYRMDWVEQYALLVTVLVFSLVCFTVVFKLVIWNRVFKILRVRTNIEDELTDMELGRCYWIEGKSHAGEKIRGLLRSMRILDVQIGQRPPRQRRLKSGQAPSVLLMDDVIVIEAPPIKPRIIYYKSGFFPLLTPWFPARTMHRLVCTVRDDEIQTHDHNFILVAGQNMERDMREPYPTFVLTRREAGFVNLDVQQYREEFDMAIEKATATVTQASNMDTFLLKEQRKYQEITVRVDAEMADIVEQEAADGKQ